jgi:hypothetical protein
VAVYARLCDKKTAGDGILSPLNHISMREIRSRPVAFLAN